MRVWTPTAIETKKRCRGLESFAVASTRQSLSLCEPAKARPQEYSVMTGKPPNQALKLTHQERRCWVAAALRAPVAG